jgi:uncharacterized protein YbaR (Trm112 family)/ubiquinone/menaquinone biosynthesis C-methylase UbiE
MKYRMVDLLECPCGNSKLTVKETVKRTVPFSDNLGTVKCSHTCAFRQCAVAGGGVAARHCNECYTQEVVEGTISCQCGRSWPIVGGIPRFLPNALAADIKKTQDTFSHEWKMFRFGERNWGQDIGIRKNLFLDAMGATPSELRGQLIFDAGCGSGLLSIEMAKSFGMEVLALDLSFGIENAYNNNDSPYVYFLQGSVLEPPVRDQAVDRLYCAGVLVACPNTSAGFKALVPKLNKGGRCFIWVYHPITRKYYPGVYRKMAIYNWIRVHITCKLPIRLQYWLYLSAMPGFLIKQTFETLTGKVRSPRTWREKMQALFDFFSPLYQHRHTPEETSGWFTEAGFTNVTVCNIGPEGFGVRGDRTNVANISESDTDPVGSVPVGIGN